MPNIFSSQPGIVTQLPGVNTPGTPNTVMTISLTDWPDFVTGKALINQIGLHEQVAIQFMTTLQNYVYVYVFGDLPTAMKISGYAFWDTCPTAGKPGMGFTNVVQYYFSHRASTRGQ